MATTETIVDLSKKIVLEKFPNIKLKFIESFYKNSKYIQCTGFNTIQNRDEVKYLISFLYFQDVLGMLQYQICCIRIS